MIDDSNLQSNGDKKITFRIRESEKTVENGIQSEIQLNEHEQETIGSVPNALALLPVFLVMLQQLKKDLDLKTKENDELKKENDGLKKENDELRKELGLSPKHHFPLLSLPDELIGCILSFLTIKDRMRARLCKRMDEIEMKYKYFVPRFIIDEFDFKNELWRGLLTGTDNEGILDGGENKNLKRFITENKDHAILLDRGNPLMSLKRIMRNATFGFLNVNLLGKDVMLIWDIYQLITECNIIKLNMVFPFSFLKDEIMVDKYLFALMNSCCKLELGSPCKITASGLQTLYTKIMDRTCKLYYINFGSCPAVLLKEFLLLIGIRFEEGDLFSERNIEAYNFKEVLSEADEEDEEVFVMNKHVFEGNFEIIFGQEEDTESGWLSMNYHKTIEDLFKAKKGLVKLDVSPQ